MGSPFRDRLKYLLIEINSIFTSEFELLTPFQYDDVQPNEKYGLITFEEFDADPFLTAKEVFKVIRFQSILTFGFDSESESEFSAPQLMLDWDNFIGVVKEQVPSHHDLFYDFQLQGAIARALRQPVRNPNVWISDVTAQGIVRIAIPKTITGSHKG